MKIFEFGCRWIYSVAGLQIQRSWVIMRIHFFVLALIPVSMNTQKNPSKTLSQENRISTDCNERDSFIICSAEKIPHLSIYSNARENEFFTFKDTLKRDFIRYKNADFIIDDLVLNQRDYTINFELNCVYLINHQKYKFLIITGGNHFQMGSDQQGLYMIFKMFEDRIEHFASYLLDSSELGDDSIKVEKRRKGIKLKPIKHKKLISQPLKT